VTAPVLKTPWTMARRSPKSGRPLSDGTATSPQIWSGLILTGGTLAHLLQAQGDLAGARPLCERALAIDEKVLGREHPNTNRVRHNFARLLLAEGKPKGYRPSARTYRSRDRMDVKSGLSTLRTSRNSSTMCATYMR
jgi:hypothetical protein